MYKKIISVMLTICMMVTVTACGSSLGSTNTHAKELGVGEPITADTPLTYEMIKKYSDGSYLIEYYKSIRCSTTTTCLLDNTVTYDSDFTYKIKGEQPDLSYSKDKTNECEHTAANNELEAGDYQLESITEENGLIKAVFKADLTNAEGYVEATYLLDPDSCLTISVDSTLYKEGTAIERTISKTAYNK